MPASEEEPQISSVAEYEQALWDIYATLGFDTDGSSAPHWHGSTLIRIAVEAAAEARTDYDELLREVSIPSEDVARWTAIGKRYEDAGAISFVVPMPPEDEANDW